MTRKRHKPRRGHRVSVDLHETAMRWLAQRAAASRRSLSLEAALIVEREMQLDQQREYDRARYREKGRQPRILKILRLEAAQ